MLKFIANFLCISLVLRRIKILKQKKLIKEALNYINNLHYALPLTVEEEITLACYTEILKKYLRDIDYYVLNPNYRTTQFLRGLDTKLPISDHLIKNTLQDSILHILNKLKYDETY